MQQKLITFAVPCYNSEAYMDHCIGSLLTGGDSIEIILIDDGSTKDNTPAICDLYAAKYPEIVKVIHQENGGHGEGVNQGLLNATGIYYKVVDSDDWLDEASLSRVMKKLQELVNSGHPVDMMICNYVYEHVEDNTRHTVRYTSVLPIDQIFTWNQIGHFKQSQNLLMHSVIYRTEMLRNCGMTLPKHTFYVDNIFVYQPLPYVKTMYYMNEDLYRYYIGRSDQSVNESVMIKRVDQQILVTKIMMNCHDLQEIKKTNRRLGKYMTSYLAIMMAVSSILLDLEGSKISLRKRDALWADLHRVNSHLYNRMKYTKISGVTILPGRVGRKVAVKCYHVAQKLYKFN